MVAQTVGKLAVISGDPLAFFSFSQDPRFGVTVKLAPLAGDVVPGHVVGAVRQQILVYCWILMQTCLETCGASDEPDYVRWEHPSPSMDLLAELICTVRP